MKEFDPSQIKEIQITAIDSDGKRWEIEPKDWAILHGGFELSAILPGAKITGPYSAPPDHVKIAGVVPLKE